MRNLPRNKGKIRKPVHRIIRGKRGERQVSTNGWKSITRLSQPRIQHLERIGSRRFRYRNSRHVNPITERFVSGERNGREEEQEGRRLSAIDIDAPYPVDRNSFPSSVGDEGPSKVCPRVFQSKLEAREEQAWKRFTRAQESDGSGLSDIIYRMKPAITDLEVNLFFYFLFFSLTVDRREMEKVGRPNETNSSFFSSPLEMVSVEARRVSLEHRDFAVSKSNIISSHPRATTYARV